MAKGRWWRRARPERAPSEPDPAPAGRQETTSAGRADDPDSLVDRIQALRQEVDRARSEAEARGQVVRADLPAAPDAAEGPHAAEGPAAAGSPAPAPGPTPPVHHRRAPLLVAGVPLLIIAGVVVGLVADTSPRHSKPAAIAAYLTAHVPAGTPVGLIGTEESDLPAQYRTVAITETSLGSLTSLPYVVTPDPVAAAGPQAAAFVQDHAQEVAADPGRALLWKVHSTASPATTTAPSTPSTTPPTTTPPTTTLPSTTPSTSPPKGGGGHPENPPPAPPGPALTTLVVRPGDSFWSIATAEVDQRLGLPATTTQITPYWAHLIAVNAGRLPVPGNPNLIYAGTVLSLPALG